MRKRNLMQITVTRTTKADADPSYGTNYMLPMSEADAPASETCAALMMEAINAQLDFAGSKVRLRAWDTEHKEYVVFQERK